MSKSRKSKLKQSAPAPGATELPAATKPVPPAPKPPAPKSPAPKSPAPKPPAPEERLHAARPQRTARTRWLVLAAIALTWLCGFGVRALWVPSVAEAPGGAFQERRLLATADAYYYASGVQREVNGALQANPRVQGAGSNIIVAIASGVVALGVSVEQTCLWLPAVLAPLIAVPLVLLGLLFGELLWGFLAGLVASLGFSYWNRTVPGYFDTDMVAITYVLAVAALLAAAFWRQRSLFGAGAALLSVIAGFVHPGSERVLVALTLGVMAYTLVFARRDAFAYRVVVMQLVAIMPLEMWQRALLIAAIEIALSRWRMPRWALWSLAAAALGCLAFVLLTSNAMNSLLGIIGISSDPGPPILAGVQFPGLGDTVAELANPSFSKMSDRIAGHTVLMLAGLAGYLLACWRFRPLLMLLPLVGLGTVFAASSQRFTIFAVPVVALGNIWLALVLGRLAARWISPRREALLRVALPVALSSAALVPAVTHALALPPRTALNTQDAELLSQLAPHVTPGDFLITWWDYAYGAWYFAGVNTIVDGSKQQADPWIVSEMMFTSSQREAAGLARLAAEHQVGLPPMDPVIDDMVRPWQAETKRPVSDFVPALREGSVTLPTPTRRVFVYIPWRFVTIALNVVGARAAGGLLPAAELEQRPVLIISTLDPEGQARSGWQFDAQAHVLVGPKGQREDVYKVTDVARDKQGNVRKRETDANPAGRVAVVNLRHNGMRLYVDRSIYESVLGQLLFLGSPDPRYFELVASARGGVVYRVLP